LTKWTGFQLGTFISIGLLIVGKQLYDQQIIDFISSLYFGIQPSIIFTFLTVVVTIWTCALLFYWQDRKSKTSFTHKIWRIMPAISGGLLFLSILGFIILGLTVLSNVTPQLHWLLDMFVVYFLMLFYLFIFSIVVRYGKQERPGNKVFTSAHIAVLIVLITLFFIPGI